MIEQKEPEWLIDLIKAADGLITLPDDTVQTITAKLAEDGKSGEKEISSEQLLQALRAVRRIQDNLALSNTAREAFCSFIRNRSNQRSDGSLMTYRDIAEVFGNYKTHTTYRNWMKLYFPDVAEAMREQHV